MKQETLDQIMGGLMQNTPQELLGGYRNTRTPQARERLTRVLKKRLKKVEPLVMGEGLQDVEGWLRGIIRQCLRSGDQGAPSNEVEEVLQMLTSIAMESLPPDWLAALQRPHTLELREEVAERLSGLYTNLMEQFVSR